MKLRDPCGGSRATADESRYALKITPDLLKAIAAAERAEVGANCGGTYRDGEICGLDFHPITCAQDIPEADRLYRVVSALPERQVISTTWGEVVASYRMVLDGNMWKLDGIACHPSPRFNMP